MSENVKQIYEKHSKNRPLKQVAYFLQALFGFPLIIFLRILIILGVLIIATLPCAYLRILRILRVLIAAARLMSVTSLSTAAMFCASALLFYFLIFFHEIISA